MRKSNSRSAQPINGGSSGKKRRNANKAGNLGLSFVSTINPGFEFNETYRGDETPDFFIHGTHHGRHKN